MGETLTEEEVARIVAFVRRAWAGVDESESWTTATADALARHDDAQRRTINGQVEALNALRAEVERLTKERDGAKADAYFLLKQLKSFTDGRFVALEVAPSKEEKP